MVTFFGAITGWFMKWALLASHLKFLSAIATGNVHHVLSHFVYVDVYRVVRPALFWSPI